jgi:hypothetical protein
VSARSGLSGSVKAVDPDERRARCIACGEWYTFPKLEDGRPASMWRWPGATAAPHWMNEDGAYYPSVFCESCAKGRAKVAERENPDPPSTRGDNLGRVVQSPEPPKPKGARRG